MPVIVTRPTTEARKWLDGLRHAGFDARALPLIAISPAPDPAVVRAAWERIESFDAVMFVSANAVAQFFALKPAQSAVFNADAAIKTRAFVTGPGSLSALQRVCVDARYIDAPDPDSGQFDSEALWAVVAHRVQPGFRLLVVRGTHAQTHTPSENAAEDGVDVGIGRDWFAEQVRAAGGEVEFVVAYQRTLPLLTDQELALAQQAAVDGSVWLFSSSEAIDNLVRVCPNQSWGQAKALVTHPRIARTAREAGFAVVLESRPTLASLMASIESLQ
ncbi:MAG: uroporphyrinogen-III synthase [Rhodoferax sp.]|nr:uroporphyrinogen-III synthase [Rhodoferax sp.]